MMGRGSFLELSQGRQPAEAEGEERPLIRDHIFFLERAWQEMYAGNTEAALKDFSHALSQCLQLEEAWLGQCLALLDLGECEEAVLWAQKALEHCPGSGSCFTVRAVGLARMGLLEKAFGFLETAQRAKPDHWVFWLGRAEVLVISEKLANAEYCLRKAIELGGAPRYWIFRRAGEMMLLHDHSYLGLRYLKQALELEPAQAMNYLRVAQAYQVLGQKKEASKYCNLALNLKPGLKEAYELRSQLSRMGVLLQVWSRARRGISGASNE